MYLVNYISENIDQLINLINTEPFNIDELKCNNQICASL